MSLTFKSKTTTTTTTTTDSSESSSTSTVVIATNTLNGYTMNYSWTMEDGTIIGEVSGSAITTDGSRRVMTMATSDASLVTGRLTKKTTDDVSGVSDQMEEDILAIYNNPDSYSSAAE